MKVNLNMVQKKISSKLYVRSSLKIDELYNKRISKNIVKLNIESFLEELKHYRINVQGNLSVATLEIKLEYLEAKTIKWRCYTQGRFKELHILLY